MAKNYKYRIECKRGTREEHLVQKSGEEWSNVASRKLSSSKKLMKVTCSNRLRYRSQDINGSKRIIVNMDSGKKLASAPKYHGRKKHNN
jgi:hypothetical protein